MNKIYFRCGTCKIIEPAFQEFSGEFKTAEFYKADVEEMEVLSDCFHFIADLKWVADKEKVGTLPFFAAFQNGKQLGYYPGSLKDKLKDFIAKHAKPQEKEKTN